MNQHESLNPFPFDIQTDELYDLGQLAEKLGVSKSKIQKMDAHDLPVSISVCGRRVWTRQAVNRWVADNNPELWEICQPNAHALAAIKGQRS